LICSIFFNSQVSLLTYCLNDLSIGEKGILKPLAILVLIHSFIHSSSSSHYYSYFYSVLDSICFFCPVVLKLGMLTFGIYMFIIIVSSCWILSVWSDVLCIFWLILVWSQLHQIWVYLLLLNFRLHLFGKSYSILFL
jgi:hypothetical protein